MLNKVFRVMAMSSLYSKIAPKPVKRFQDSISVSQTNAWVNGELFFSCCCFFFFVQLQQLSKLHQAAVNIVSIRYYTY